MSKTRFLSLLMAILLVFMMTVSCNTDEPVTPDDSNQGNEDIVPEPPVDGEDEEPSVNPDDSNQGNEDIVPEPPVDGEDEEPSVNPDDDPDEEPDVDAEYVYPSEEILYLRENLPLMDGSTSLIPLEAGLRAKIFDITINEATTDVKHSTTYGSFERLLNKEVDIIFSTPLSEEQYEQAAAKGMDLELVPIAAEAFVFVINANNPIDSLTQQQIKDIYSGKITNWKEVGGEDVEIVAFQRNQTSGSQNYMREFMGDLELSTAPTETIPNSMGSLMDAIADYDNSRNAIGYSVYAYAADMYGLGDTMKFVKVDGVAPTKDSMNDKSYPLTNYNYVIYDKNTVTESAERMVNWICTREGQQAIADAGYIPANASIDREYLVLFGTGAELPENIDVQSRQYTAELTLTAALPENCEEITEDTLTFLKRYDTTPVKVMTGIKWEISGLADKEIQSKINTKISEMAARADGRTADMIDFINKANQSDGSEYNWYFPYESFLSNSVPKTPNKMSFYIPFEVTVQVINGYLCITVEMKYQDSTDIFIYNYYTESAFFDLYTGEELQLTDIFYKDTDIAAILNNYFSGFDFTVDSYVGPQRLKTWKDFTQFSAKDGFALSFDKFYFNYDNTILKDGYAFYIDFPLCSRITETPRDMEGIFESKSKINQSLRTKYHNIYESVDGCSTIFSAIPETGPFAEANKRINETMRELVKTTPPQAELEAGYRAWGRTYDDSCLYYFSADEFIGELIVFSGATAGFDNVYRAESIIFDAQTGERISYKDVLKDGWEEHSSFTSFGSRLTAAQKAQIEQKIIPDDVSLGYVYLNHRKNAVELVFHHIGSVGWQAFYLVVEEDYVNYFN